MVLDNHEAMLQVGDQVPIVTQTAQSVTDPDAPVVNSVELKDTGVILAVLPHVNESGRVVLDVQQEVSSVIPTTTSGIDSPTIRQRKLATTVVVGDGETLTLGGLIQDHNSQSRTKVPVLGDIPVIGAAFRHKEDSVERTELIVFIRPRIVHDVAQARRITDEYRSQLTLQAPEARKPGETMQRDAARAVR
jgi:general secretion pathway protein D